MGRIGRARHETPSGAGEIIVLYDLDHHERVYGTKGTPAGAPWYARRTKPHPRQTALAEAITVAVAEAEARAVNGSTGEPLADPHVSSELKEMAAKLHHAALSYRDARQRITDLGVAEELGGALDLARSAR